MVVGSWRMLRIINPNGLSTMESMSKMYEVHMSLCVRKPTIWVPIRINTNWAVQSQKLVRGLKFWIEKIEDLYYMCNKNKGADQLRSYCKADMRLCFRICKLLISQEVAHITGMKESFVEKWLTQKLIMKSIQQPITMSNQILTMVDYIPFHLSLPFEHLHYTRRPCVLKIWVSFHVVHKDAVLSDSFKLNDL